MLNKAIKSLEFDKILDELSAYSVLDKTKAELRLFSPCFNLKDAKICLEKTEEAYKLLYTYSVGGVYYFSDVSEQLKRVSMGGVLNNGELLKIRDNLKSARILKSSFSSVNDNTIVLLREICSRLYVNDEFENEITTKIISEDEISDHASQKLYSIRKSIRDINARIRSKLNSYIRGGNAFLQDAVVTMRQGRYVIPVKSEFRSQVKGFIHDQSSSGATVFIEPESIIEANNDLKKAYFDEANEIYNILRELSEKVTFMTDALKYNHENISEIDSYFARAQFAFSTKSTKPILNDKGIIAIKRGRHPLIDKEKVVPVSFGLGKDYNFLLLSGPNTGGKTVTLKLTGLFALMSMSGMYIPADDDSIISVFSGVYADIGDEQSIEQSLSTFSSHLKNLINIINNIDDKSLVLIDEIGAGTDPEEGSALALAFINEFLRKKCFGIITTHYSTLKEYAMNSSGIKNACMEFNAQTLRPLYKINIGIPGSSNAIDIAKTLGLSQDILNDANSYLSQDKISFESVLKVAEQSRRDYEALKDELERVKLVKDNELKIIEEERKKISKEREKIYFNAKQETKRIVQDKLYEAEEIIDELKTILKNANLESREVFRASELKNRLKNSKYLSAEDDVAPYELIKAKASELKVNNKVFVKSLNSYAKIVSVKESKGEAEILIGNIKSKVKISDLYNSEKPEKEETKVNVKRELYSSTPKTEINLVGKTSLEALEEIKYFLDSAIVYNLAEVKIIHGVGEGVLIKTIREFLKGEKAVKEFRRGKYGEGENGVTIVTLK